MSILIRLCAAAAIAVLGACATRAPSPAPVENRTRPPAGASAPAAPAPAPSPAPSPAAVASPDAPVVQTAPVRSSGVESRPLARTQVPAAEAAGTLRREPKGLKRPYSEATLAELRAADAGGHGATSSGATGSGATASGAAASGATGSGSASAGAATAGAGAGAGAAGTGGAGPASAGAAGAASAGAGTAAGAAAAGTAASGAAASGAAAPGAAKPGATSSGAAASGTPSAADGEFSWPAKGKVVQGFSEPRHMGILISGSPGDPVTAVADGQVIFSGPGPRGYGNLLIVKHDAETLSVYAHNRALLVKERERVKRGQRIAELGDTGTDRPQLHFEIRKSGKPVDPIRLLPPR